MKKYWVYIHITPDGMVYVGRSGAKYISQRWTPSSYKRTSLEPHIKKWGWENIKHEIIKDNLSKEDSYKLEDELIKMYQEKGVCINKQQSGGLQCDGKRKEYRNKNKEKINNQIKDYYNKHKEELKEYNRNYYKTHKEKWIKKKEVV